MVGLQPRNPFVNTLLRGLRELGYAGRGPEGVEPLDARPVTRRCYHVREVAAARAGRAVERRLRAPADPDRRPTGRHRPGREGDVLHAHVSPGEAHPLLAPQPAHAVESLVGPRAALPDEDPARGELRRVLVTDPDPHDEPAARHVVERGEVLGGKDGMAEGQEVDRGAEADPPRTGGEAGEEDRRARRLRVEEHVLARPPGVEPSASARSAKSHHHAAGGVPSG